MPQWRTTEDNVPYFAVDSLNYNANLEYFGTDRNKYFEGRAISNNASSEPSLTFAERLFSSSKYHDILNKYYWLITWRQSESSNTVDALWILKTILVARLERQKKQPRSTRFFLIRMTMILRETMATGMGALSRHSFTPTPTL